jgi:hypothetical protein
VWDRTPLGPIDHGVGACGEADASSLRQTLREAGQDRCSRRRSDLIGGQPADYALRSYQEHGAAGCADAAQESRGAHRQGTPIWTRFVAHIDYNARSQRTCIDYGNGAATTYDYDSKTFRMLRLKTVRPSDHEGLTTQIFDDASQIQDLHCTYDPAGNITQIADCSLRTVFHRNQRIDPACRYTYDPLYRLVEASGRESIG